MNKSQKNTDEFPTREDIRLRNLDRIEDLQKRGIVYCPAEKSNITNLMKCMFCAYGHMTECHYPYDCNSEYCNHYNNVETITGRDI
jgi:hypothetical protein